MVRRASLDSREVVELPDGTEATTWTELTDAGDGQVSFLHHYSFRDGQELESSATLRFRSLEELRDSLKDAWFVVTEVFGGWQRQPVGPGDDGEFLIIAQR